MSNNQNVNINTTESSYISEDISIFNDDYIEEHLDKLILGNIQKGVFHKIYAKKLILFSLATKKDTPATIEQKEATYYFRYYYLMIARFILEERIRLYNHERDKKDLDNLNEQYTAAREQYKKIREKIKWPEFYIVEQFIDAVNPKIRCMAAEDNNTKTVILSDTRTDKPKGGEQFFIPETDFYGRINEIRITSLNINGLIHPKLKNKKAFDVLRYGDYCMIKASTWTGEMEKYIQIDIDENTKVEIR